MLRVTLFSLLTLLVVAPDRVSADWHSFWNRTEVDFHRNVCWPEPFQQADRRTVCAALSTQIASGWKRQNTLSDVYFDRETQQLNESGRQKVWSVLNASPEQYRTIYVVQSMNPEAQERRIDSIEQTAREFVKDQPLPEVVSVKIPPRSWSAEYIDAIDRKIQSSIPAPRLPTFTNTTGK